MSETLSSAVEDTDLFSQAYPDDLRREESRLLNRRRGLDEKDPRPASVTGCGLSGGGIRSATFSLGVFQGLAARSGLLEKIDFLSTVSGGGYFGAFLGRLFSRDYVESPADVEAILQSRRKPEVLRFLRENGRYLSPNGAGDELLAGASILRNLASVHLVITTFCLTFFLALQTVRIVVESSSRAVAEMDRWSGVFWRSPFLWFPLATLVIAVLPLGWAYWLIRSERQVLGKGSANLNPWWGLYLVFILSLWLSPSLWGPILPWAARAVLVIATATLAWRIAAWVMFRWMMFRPLESGEWLKTFRFKELEDLDARLYLNRWIPNRLAVWLARSLAVTALLLALGVVDSLGQSLYVLLKNRELLTQAFAGLASTVAVLVAFARQISSFFSGKGSSGQRPSLPLRWIAGIVAFLLVAVLLVGLNVLSHAIVWRFEAPPEVSAAPSRSAASGVMVKVDRKASPVNVDVKVALPPSERVSAVSAQDAEEQRRQRLIPAVVALTSGLLLSLLFGQTWAFLNKSSFHPMYSERLTRAYLGASNPERLGEDAPSLTEPVQGDDEDLARYWPPPVKKKTFLHLINVTINETIDGRSQIQQQDRKGLGMALGPCGLSAGVQHHALLPFGSNGNADPVGTPVNVFPKKGFQIFDFQDDRFAGEMLPLGSWVGISGAAFSTGTGMNTSLGLSLLTGLGNVRLGRWWDSGILRERDGAKLGSRIEAMLAHVFPVQTYLLDEFLARFPGTARRHWYLSDGGHFENMGGYELVRRRLEKIVIVDGEQDAVYGFEGLANLIRKARLDFGAEIEFLDETALDREVTGPARRAFGTLDQLRRGTWEETKGTNRGGRSGKLLEANPEGLSLAHAALARITYAFPSQAESRLLYIKPTLTGDEPADIAEYHRNHPAFPHEPTIDQFFDEAQWESYRKLGQHISTQISGFLQTFL